MTITFFSNRQVPSYVGSSLHDLHDFLGGCDFWKSCRAICLHEKHVPKKQNPKSSPLSS